MDRSKILSFLAFIGLLAIWFGFRKVHSWNEINGETMGSTYRLEYGLPRPLPNHQRLDQVVAELRATMHQADARLSTWHSTSELSQFNSQQSTEWFPVDASTVAIIAQAAEIHAIDPRFDVSVAPLSDLWGLGPGGRGMQAPSRAEIEECLKHVGMHKLEFRREPPALRKLDPQLQIDLSSLAAGYVADRLAEQLRHAGASNFYIEVAGEIIVSGHNRRGTKWRVGIAEPQVGSTRIRDRLELTDCAIATSGNYRKFIELDGKSYGHILDPTTGRTAETDILSATVLHQSCAQADAIATLLMTMPADEAQTLANQQGWNVKVYTTEAHPP